MIYKVLYAEDEPSLAQVTSYSLKENGYDVQLTNNGETALQLFKQREFDICLFDITMPFKDGYTLAEDIRKLNADVPIIFVSGKTLDQDVVRGFKSGGNDYLKKPFSITELLVRMGALLSRSKFPDPYRFCGCTLNTNNQQLKTPCASYDLSYKESALLELLLKHKNTVLPRQKALIEIWGDNSIYNSNSMNVFMTRLRRLIGDDPNVEIITIRNIGYKLICG